MVGEAAARQGVVLHELAQQTGSLEDAFLKATADVVDFRAGEAPGGQPQAWNTAPAGPPSAGWMPPPPPASDGGDAPREGGW